MTADILSLTASQITESIRSKEFTALEITEAYLRNIEASHEIVNAFTEVTAERARAEATVVDQANASGYELGPLAGVPFSAKNLFDIKGVTTTAGSIIHAERPPASEDATSVARFSAAGAICLGATNMGEYAYDFSTINAHYGPTRNPHDTTRSAGGSSGGSAASVAGGLSSLSLGTDTNGSIRVPASFCGIWGMKPTYGHLSRAGGLLFAGSLDTIGVFGRSVQDIACATDVLSGPDSRDPVCVSESFPSLLTTMEDGVSGLRIGILGEYFAEGGVPAAHRAVDLVAEALGATETICLPYPDIARAAAYAITSAEGGDLHRDRVRKRAMDFDPSGRDRFIAGALMPAAWYIKAQRFRAWWQDQIKEIFRSVDILLAPSTPMHAPGLDETTMQFMGKTLPLKPNIGLFTQPITLIGLPVISAPVHFEHTLPIGVQLIAAPHQEAKLVQAARILENSGISFAPLNLASIHEQISN
jgi:AtzE family amidohydrolase